MAEGKWSYGTVFSSKRIKVKQRFYIMSLTISLYFCHQILKPGGLENFQVVLKAQIVYKNALTCAVQQAHACQPAKEQEIIKRYCYQRSR